MPEKGKANDRTRQQSREYRARNLTTERERCREVVAKWKAENPEAAAESVRKTQAMRKSRRRVVSKGIKKLLYKVQHGRCFHCAELLPVEPKNQSIDHLKPLAMGGLDDDGNVALTHRVCNLQRPMEDAGPGPLCYTMEGA